MSLVICFVFEKRERVFDARGSGRYKPPDPNYHERKCRAGQGQSASNRAVTSLTPSPEGQTQASCSVSRLHARAHRSKTQEQDDARVHGPRRGGRRAGGRRLAVHCGGIRRRRRRGGARLRRTGFRSPRRRGPPRERGRRGGRHPRRRAPPQPHRRRPRQRPLRLRPGHGRGRPGPGHARAGPPPPHPPRPHLPIPERVRRRRAGRRAVGGGAPLGREAARAGARVVDRLPPAHRRRDAVERRRERAVVPVRPAGVQRGRAGGGHGRRRVPRVLAVYPPGPLLRRARRAGPVRGHHPGTHPAPPGAANGAVDPGGVRELRGLHGGRGVAGDAPGGRGVRLRGGLRVRQQRRPGQRLADGAVPGRRGVRPGPAPGRGRTGALLPRGGPVPAQPAPAPARRRRRRRQGEGEDEEEGERDDGAAQIRAGAGVRRGRRVRGVPVAREPGGGGGPAERQLGGAAPVAQPLRLGAGHRGVRRRRDQGHARGRHRRAHAHLPHAQEQVGPEHVGGAPRRRDLLPGGAAPVLPRRRRGGGGAGVPEPCRPGRLPRQRLRLQDLLPELPERARVAGPLRRHKVEALRRPQGPVRPARHPRAGPEDLPAGHY